MNNELQYEQKHLTYYYTQNYPILETKTQKTQHPGMDKHPPLKSHYAILRIVGNNF